MNKKMEKALAKRIMEMIEQKQPSYMVLAFCQGWGALIVDGLALVSNLEVDLRFDNLVPTVRKIN